MEITSTATTTAKHVLSIHKVNNQTFMIAIIAFCITACGVVSDESMCNNIKLSAKIGDTW